MNKIEILATVYQYRTGTFLKIRTYLRILTHVCTKFTVAFSRFENIF